jgi:hypothetical protein
MKTIEQVKHEYRIEAEELLSQHPEELRAFEKLWTSEKLREAYIYVMETTRRLNLVPTERFEAAEGEFFWGYVH